MNLDAFYPQGNTVCVGGSSTSAGVGTQWSTASFQALRLVNPSSQAAYCAFAASSVGTATFATTSASGTGFPVRAGGEVVVSVSPLNTWLSACTSGGALSPGVFATPGSGI